LLLKNKFSTIQQIVYSWTDERLAFKNSKVAPQAVKDYEIDITENMMDIWAPDLQFFGQIRHETI